MFIWVSQVEGHVAPFDDPLIVYPRSMSERAFRLREKLPEILIEAASVVVAVLLAFAVDEWRDARAKREVAERAKRSIVSELQANRDELSRSFGENAAHLRDLQST